MGNYGVRLFRGKLIGQATGIWVSRAIHRPGNRPVFGPEVILIGWATRRWENIFSRLFERETARKERCGTSWHLGNQMSSPSRDELDGLGNQSIG